MANSLLVIIPTTDDHGARTATALAAHLLATRVTFGSKKLEQAVLEPGRARGDVELTLIDRKSKRIHQPRAYGIVNLPGSAIEYWVTQPGDFFYVLRAQDETGNIDSDTIKVAATTPATGDITPPSFTGLGRAQSRSAASKPATT